MVKKAPQEKYRLVIEVDGKTFKESDFCTWHRRRHLAKEAKRLNQFLGIKAYVETMVF